MLARSLPVCEPRPTAKSYRLSTVIFDRPVEFDYATLVASFAVVLARANAAERVCIGCPFVSDSIIALVGVELDVSPDLSFLNLIKQFKGEVQRAEAWSAENCEALSAETLPCVVAAVGQKNLGRSPFRSVDLELLAQQTVAADIVLTINLDGRLQCEFDTDLFGETSVQYLLDQVIAVACQANTDVDRLIDSIDPLGEAERKQLSILSQRTWIEPQDCLQERFAQQVQCRPDATAVCHRGLQLTYRELDAWSNALALRLRGFGVSTGERVALEVEPTVDSVVGMLGILKIGGTYVPIDARAPAARKHEIVELAQSRFVVVKDFGAWNDVDAICIPMVPQSGACDNKDLETRSRPDDPAYVLFTSGSTGTPKGVEVSHHSVIRLFDTTRELFGFRNDDVWLNAHSLTFDASVWEIYGALMTGACVVIAPRETILSPDLMVELIETEGVSIVTLSPTAFEGFRDSALERDAKFKNLRFIVLCAEALSPACLARWVARWGDERPALVNMYGITETTVHSTFYRLSARDIGDPRRKIGVGIPDTPVYLLDSQKRVVPFGTQGEIFIGGPGVSLGYLGAPSAHASRFTADHYSEEPNARMYRSGDLARRLPDGTLEYLGRLDRQVKIRGYRIELGEIEAVLLRHPDVSSARAWVIHKADRPPLLAAAIIPRAQSRPNTVVLRDFLLGHLPEYMVPFGIVAVDEFPRTVNGKLDERRLPEPFQGSSIEDDSGEEADDHVASIARVMATVLGIPTISKSGSFFSYGGDSITAVRLAARLRSIGLEIRVGDIYRMRTPLGLASILGSHVQDDLLTSVPLVPVDPIASTSDALETFPATRLQRGMFLHSTLDQSAYHDVLCYTIKLAVDEEAFRDAIRAVVSSNIALRSSFDLAASPPLQRVHRSAQVVCQFIDLRAVVAMERQRQIDRWIESEQRLPFIETEAGLLRFGVHRTEDQEFVLAISVHHSILDGWSAASLVTELLLTYRQIQSAIRPTIRSGRTILRRYSELEQKVEQSREARNFWVEYLRDARPVRLGLAPISIGQTTPLNEYALRLSQQTIERLRNIGRNAAVPMKTVYLAIHATILAFLSGTRTVVSGLISTGRLEEEGGDEELGLFLNTIPIRLSVGRQDWRKLLSDVFEQETTIFPFRRFPLDRIQNAVGVGGLCSNAFNYTDFHVYDRLNAAGIEVSDVRYFERTDFELLASVHVDPFGSAATITVSHRLDEKDALQARYYALLFESLADEFGRTDDQPVFAILERHAQEMELTLKVPPGAVAIYPSCVLALIVDRLQKTPFDAVVDGGACITSQDIAQRVSFLRERLAAAGLTVGGRVACFLERGVDPLVAMLGIWAAGGTYVPLDSRQPTQRQSELLQQARCSVALRSCAIHINPAVWQGPIIPLDLPCAGFPIVLETWRIAPPSDEAYVLFTSGSSGQPKGVVMSHRSLANLISWQACQPEFAEPRNISQFAPLMFDVSIQEFLTALVSGGTLHVVDEATRSNPETLLHFLNSNAIEVAFLPPTVLHQLATASRVFDVIPKNLRHIITAGERLTINQTLRSFCAAIGAELINQYGPTETHVVTCHRLGPDLSIWPERPPIGRLIDNVRAEVLGPDRQSLFLQSRGELYICGVAVALGYIHGATQDTSFIYSSDGDLRYKTGDMARLSGSDLEFEGRIDDQIKVRGYRVEPGEISAVIRRHSKVSECFVCGVENPACGTTTAAFVVASDPSLTITELDAYVRNLLPEYLVPQSFELLDRLPTTTNGKVDRNALPRARSLRPRPDFAGSVSPAERRVLKVWSNVLGYQVSTPVVSFFEAGGDSLRALELYMALQKEYGTMFPMLEVFQFPTARAFAAKRGVRSSQVLQPTTTAQGPAQNADQITAIAERRIFARRKVSTDE